MCFLCPRSRKSCVACVWSKTHVLTASREAKGQERGLVAGGVRTVGNTKISGPPLACHSAVFEQGVTWAKPAGWQEWPRFRSRWEGPCVSGWNGSGPSVVNSQSITQTLLCNLTCVSAISGRPSATSGGATRVVVGRALRGEAHLSATHACYRARLYARTEVWRCRSLPPAATERHGHQGCFPLAFNSPLIIGPTSSHVSTHA
jgi:hypothetical protein